MPNWRELFRAMGRAGVPVEAGSAPVPVGGGDISAAWQVPAADGPVFLKTGPAAALEMFEAEAEGLRELAAANALRVPGMLGSGSSAGDAWLALEWITLGPPGPDSERRLGERLAVQHRRIGPAFGWHRDNTIGTTPQQNDADGDWIRFFRQRRLLVQLQLADSLGYGGELLREGARLAKRIDRLFGDYRPQPSLLHGDLWSGNWGATDGEPVVFDPAVYYGDREADLAMTRLFGGFGGAFYRAYEAAWPLAEGHERRTALYQLYHVLNHLNLFAAAWHGRALALVRQLNRTLDES